MPAPKNPLKAALAEGREQVGIWLSSGEPYLAEIAATVGFDWLLIDGEHGPNDIRSISAQLSAIKGSGSHPVVRVPKGEDWILKQVLDAGCQSILVPLVENAAHAAELVRMVRYPPGGYRGMGAATARASNFGQASEYVQTANDQICLIVQVETKEALDDLDAIVATEGVDGVFIGPADLSANLGHPGGFSKPEMVEVVMDALRRIRAGGKAPGVLYYNAPENIAKAREAGCLFTAIGLDVAVLVGGLKGLKKEYG